jgi:hypothetical protein
MAQAFIDLGLKDLGYEYVHIDDCWTLLERDSDGNLVPGPEKWPNGVKAVADEIHALGLKFGLYGDAGYNTCAARAPRAMSSKTPISSQAMASTTGSMTTATHPAMSAHPTTTLALILQVTRGSGTRS